MNAFPKAERSQGGWLEGALARAEQLDDWLSPERRQSLAQLRETPWPNRKTEAWKYTPLTALERSEFSEPAGDAPPVDVIEGLNSIDVLIHNGVVVGEQMPALPEGLGISALQSADAAQQEKIRQLFGASKPQHHLFGLVNDVLARDGLLIEVAAGVRIDKPLRIVHSVSEGADAHGRVLVHLEAGAELAVIEQVIGNQPSFNTTISEYQLAQDARLEHYRFAMQTGGAMAVGGCHFRLGERSELNSSQVGFGSELSRLDTDIIYAGEKANANLNAIYLLSGSEIFDLHSTVEHAVPCCTTDEKVRGIVADRARAVFNGRIHIHPKAQKTLAELNNRNLLLSDKAVVNTKPELEIYADDVRCAHGATIAQMDKRALYYLQSRGLSRAQAQVMLNFGFINELVDQMPNEALAQWLRPQLRERFAQMQVD